MHNSKFICQKTNVQFKSRVQCGSFVLCGNWEKTNERHWGNLRFLIINVRDTLTVGLETGFNILNAADVAKQNFRSITNPISYYVEIVKIT